MRFRRLGIGAIIILLLMYGSSSVWASMAQYRGFPVVRVTVNGEDLVSDFPAINMDGRTLLPVRAVAEALGADVQWDGQTQSVVISSPGLKQGTTYLWVDTAQDGWKAQVDLVLASPNRYDGLLLLTGESLSVVGYADLAALARGELTAEAALAKSGQYVRSATPRVQQQSVSQPTAACKAQRQAVVAQIDRDMRDLRSWFAGAGTLGGTGYGEAVADVYLGYEVQWLGTDCGKAAVTAMGSTLCEQLDAWKESIFAEVRSKVGTGAASVKAQERIETMLRPLFTSARCS